MRRSFFADDIQRFYKVLQTPSGAVRRLGRGVPLDRISIIDAIGEGTIQANI